LKKFTHSILNSVDIGQSHFAESGPEKILGMRWIPKADMFEFQVKINFSPKHRNIRTGKNIARNQIDCSVLAAKVNGVASPSGS
jgi:uncharacterized protein YecE (DUF72 family)